MVFENHWHNIDRERRENDEDRLERRQRLANSFVPLSDVTPTIPLDELENMESLDDVRGTVRGREKARKFRNTRYDEIMESEKLARMGYEPAGIQVYPGYYSGSANHAEIDEGIITLSGSLNVEKTEQGKTTTARMNGPLTLNELKNPDTKMKFGISRYLGEEVPILEVTVGDKIMHLEAFEVISGTHRVAKPLGQESPTIVFIFKDPRRAKSKTS